MCLVRSWRRCATAQGSPPPCTCAMVRGRFPQWSPVASTVVGTRVSRCPSHLRESLSAGASLNVSAVADLDRIAPVERSFMAECDEDSG